LVPPSSVKYILVNSLTLPGSTVRPDCMAAPKRSHRPAHSAAGSHQSKTILLVEDDSQLRTLLTRILEKDGYTVQPAKDGNDAFRRCLDSDGAIDLLLTDVILPGINGIDLVQFVETRWPEVRVIMFSGQIDGSSLVDYRREVTPLLAKPLDPQTLLKAVREVLKP
jgi:two-component system cell cycle sensor histidine kinase/response regulator CckA